MTTPGTGDNTPQPAKKKGKALWITTLLFLLCGAAWCVYWFLYGEYYEYTDDAYAAGNKIVVSPAVPGSVVAYFADDTNLVKEGQLLVLLDKTPYEIGYQSALSSLAETVLKVRQIYDNVKVQEAVAKTKTISLDKLRYDFENRSRLVEAKAVSNEDFVHAEENLRIAEAELDQAEKELEKAKDAAGTTSIESHPLIEKEKSNVREAYYKLFHTEIYAPDTGYVAQRSVEVGQWVDPGTPLLAVIPIEPVWVDANFKETQLTNMRIGQPAEVWFDLYGDSVKFEGTVVGIASGTGSVFSLIPPQNATGNWIKIVQRLPVRIALNKEQTEKYPLRLGISSEVYVDIHNQDLPYLTQIPSKEAKGATRVFNPRLAQVDKVIDEVISSKLL